MGNGFGALYVGVAGLQSSQNALNTTANNLANVDTAGYVRQRVLFADRNYVTFNTTASISKQQSGLGVKIGDVIHTRDIFLDRSYRTESGRQAFYAASYEAVSEVETYYQEMEGEAFQGALQDFWTSFQELYKAPDDSIYQNLVIQKAQLFLSRASAVYSGLQGYQLNINKQISDDIDTINELGKSIHELNEQIQKVEAADIETAMTLRDARDQALDELSSLVSISYHELENGAVRVNIEGTEFVGKDWFYAIEKREDPTNGFITPYWAHLSNEEKGEYIDVFNLKGEISSANQNDIGELKALLLARGDYAANYTHVTGMDRDEYNNTTGMSVMLIAEAELDQLIHGIVTAINDTLCPNVSASGFIKDVTGGAGGTVTATTADGRQITIGPNTKILDTENCSFGSDGKLPPQELFTRIGTERYTTATCAVTDANGNPVLDANGNPVTKEVYIYNEEDPSDTTRQYTLKSLSVNEALIVKESLLPHLKQNGNKWDVNYEMASKLASIWDEERISLNPNDTKPCTFKDYYKAMIGEMGTLGDVYGSTASNLAGTVESVDNKRQQVFGVSSDEELTYMIRFQNAYNASSRFINVVDEMIEHLITQLG
ncbi:MAG: flagellar hook-associated protein FlgK [Roseburia sp.]|jgi:flagellar hook-associated protein 1 FlgK|nr:flagellar hook-associated protein FlgK [Roseburia sp.]